MDQKCPLSREEMLAAIDRLYRARKDGDFDGLGEIIADDAEFAFAGHDDLVRAFPGGEEDEIENVAKRLNQQLEMTSAKRRDAIAEGNKLFVLWDAEFRYQGGDTFASPLFDLWEFDEAGKICRGFQSFDTAILAMNLGILRRAEG